MRVSRSLAACPTRTRAFWANTLLCASGLVYAAVVAPAAGAQEARIQVQADTATVFVGDRITFTVTVDHGIESLVVWPDSLDLAPFEVLEARAIPPTAREGEARSSLILTLTTFELGDLEIPSFEVAVTDPEGGRTTLATNRYGIQVLSVGLDEGGDIRDIKGPVGIPLDLLPLLLGLLAIFLIGVLARALYRRFRRGDPELRNTGPAAPWRPPHEIALEALDRLEESSLLEKGEIKEFHIQLSDVIRTYVEGRFRVPALEMTTLDILPGLKERSLEPSILEGFEYFLNHCDLVKFAKYRPEPEAARSLLALGRHLVQDTVPTTGVLAPRPEKAGKPEVQEATP